MRKGFIYTLSDPDTGLVRYVGQTVDVSKRYGLHLFHSKNGRARTHKEKWINKLMADGKEPVLEVVWEGDANKLNTKEIQYIALFKSIGARLTNQTYGGETTRGRKCSEETKERFRKMFLGKCLRPPISEAEKIAIGNRSRGIARTIEEKRRLSENAKSRPWNSERISNLGRAASKPILAYKDGRQYFFASTKEAESLICCDRKTMRMVANGIYKQCHGFYFKWVNN
jgi:hypothetical protein